MWYTNIKLTLPPQVIFFWVESENEQKRALLPSAGLECSSHIGMIIH